MAGGGYRGILAAVPPAQRLRLASGNGAADQNQNLKQRQRQRQRQRLREQARSHRFCGWLMIFVVAYIPVGAGLPAKAAVHPASAITDPPLSRAGSLPQWNRCLPFCLCAVGFYHSRPSVSSPAVDFDVPAPSGGRVEVLRSGQTGMDAGLAAPGHGWPMAAGPRSRAGARAWRGLASHRTSGAEPFGYFGPGRVGPKVTRCKSETISRRYRSNGYVHLQTS